MKSVNKLLEWAKQSNPSIYWEVKAMMYDEEGCRHFNEELAKHRVENMYHISSSGLKETGEHWSIEQVKDVMHKHQDVFSNDDTCWDLYVALHIWWHDLGTAYRKHGMEIYIPEDAITFFFSDDDFEGQSKVWAYCMAV